MAFTPPAVVKKIAIVGTGVIGSGWAALFCAKGYTVVAYVRSEASKVKFLKVLESVWKNMLARGIATETEGYKSISCVFNLAECVADADYVQEAVVEDITLKQVTLQTIDEFAPPNVIVGSSTSFIPLSLLRLRAKKNPDRIAIAHPSLPHWDAFCEVLGSSEVATQWLAHLYGEGNTVDGAKVIGLGMDVVKLKKEFHGHVFNVFTLTVVQAASMLHSAGVASVRDIDKAAVHFCRLVIGGNGITGAMVGMVGGGSKAAYTDLSTEIAMGTPLAWNAVLISYFCPRFLAPAFLWLAQKMWWPWTLTKVLWRRYFAKSHVQRLADFEESPTALQKFRELAIARVCSLEKQARAESE